MQTNDTNKGDQLATDTQIPTEGRPSLMPGEATKLHPKAQALKDRFDALPSSDQEPIMAYMVLSATKAGIWSVTQEEKTQLQSSLREWLLQLREGTGGGTFARAWELAWEGVATPLDTRGTPAEILRSLGREDLAQKVEPHP